METRFQNLGPEQWSAEILLAFGFEGENILQTLPQLDKACPWLLVSPALRDFTGKKDQAILAYGHPEQKIPRVLLLGAGKRNDFNLEKLRKVVALGIGKCKALSMQSVLLPACLFANLPGGAGNALGEAVYASQLAAYEFNEFKTTKDSEEKSPAWLAVGFADQTDSEKKQRHVRQAENAAEAVCLARNLANYPGNRLFPEALALRTADLAEEAGVKCRILDENALEREGFGCMLAVGQGSIHLPRLVELEYAPEGREKDPPLALVGKGITFDSGGICLKPAANMWQMKCDMSGAAAVLSAIIAFAREKGSRRVVGLLACAENLPDGKAYRPGDILKSFSGSTVEVINTDAEGRLVLCDALAYAQKTWQPAALLDIATLTGACAVALGNQVAGLFCNDDRFAENLLALAEISGEHFWRLPLWQGYREELKSPVADLRHTASREGGAITAALFLQHFVADNLPWAHLDIAGVDFNAKASPLCQEGASGFGARLLLELCRGESPCW